MRRSWWCAFLLSCTSGPADDGPKDPDVHTDADADADTDVDADADADSDSDTDTTAPCLESAGLSVLSFTATSQQPLTNVAIDVTLSEGAKVAVACVMNDEPDQIFYAESTEVATVHALRLSGLLPLERYTCTAAPTCPTMAGPPAVLTHDIPQPPSDLRAVEIDVNPALGMTGAWTLAPFSVQAFTGQAYLVIWGPDGRVRWWWPLPNNVGKWVEARYHASDGKIVWGGGMDAEGRVRVVDPWYGEEWAFAVPGWQQEEFHHDGKRIDDGRMMTLEIRRNSSGQQSWDGFGLRVVDPLTGTVDFDYNSQRAVDAGDLEANGGFFGDPYHANWMDWVETADGPEAYVSLCFSQQIIAIDGNTGDTLWVLGANEGWNLIDENGDPLPSSALPQCQHGLEATPDRHFLVYDNGQDRNQSQAQEWFIDPATHTAQRLWMWTEPGWNEDYLGDIDDLGNGRILLTQAVEFFGNQHITEVDLATGNVASRITMTSGFTYRADRYDGCAMFTAVRECPDLEARYLEVAPLLAR